MQSAYEASIKEMNELQIQNTLLNAEIERLRVQLAGCGVAAMQNTEETVKDRIVEGDYGYSASYYDVCRAVDREIRYRDALERIIKDGDCTAPEGMKSISKDALRVAAEIGWKK